MDIKNNQIKTQTHLQYKNFTPIQINRLSLEILSDQNINQYKYKTEINYFKIILNITISIFIIITSYFIYIFPLAKSYSLTNRLTKELPELKDSIQDLGIALEQQYNFITKVEVSYNSDIILSLDYQNISKQINNLLAGTKNSPITSFPENIKNIFIAYNYHFHSNQNILGESTDLKKLPFITIQKLRKGKEIAGQIIDNAELAKKKIESFNSMIKKEPSSYKKSISEIIQKTDNTNTQTQNFIIEAEKIGNYYYLIYNINIEIIPEIRIFTETIENTMQSNNPTLYSSQFDDLELSFVEKRAKLTRLSGSEIPEGLEDLHNMNIEALESIINTIKKTKFAAIQKDSTQINEELIKLSIKLDNLNKTSYQEELNFWQDNRKIRNYKKIVNNYEDIIKEIQNILKKYNKPFVQTLSEFIS